MRILSKQLTDILHNFQLAHDFIRFDRSKEPNPRSIPHNKYIFRIQFFPVSEFSFQYIENVHSHMIRKIDN